MKPWNQFAIQEPDLADIGKKMLLQSRAQVGYAFLATLRKDGAPRLHPICVIFYRDNLFVLIPNTSPKCLDLLRDGRFAMQAFPQTGNYENEEFYISGQAIQVQELNLRSNLITDTEIIAGIDEVLFELLIDRAMYTKLENPDTPDERVMHIKWQSK